MKCDGKTAAMLVFLTLCVALQVASRKVQLRASVENEAEAPLDFMQLSAAHRSVLDSAQAAANQDQHRVRMGTYNSIKQQLLQLSNKADPADPAGAGLELYVDTVKSCLRDSLTGAINSTFWAGKAFLAETARKFDACASELDLALELPDAMLFGTSYNGTPYKGLAQLKAEHNECRNGQQAKKLEYDDCMETKSSQESLMIASCEQNYSMYYNRVAPSTTGAWGATCDNRQPYYEQNPPAPIPLIYDPGVGSTDVEGYLVERFDFFSTMLSDYLYAGELCRNRTRDYNFTSDRCEVLFEEHGNITAECDAHQDILDAESCEQAEMRHRSCLAYDRCHSEAADSMATAKRDYCGSRGVEDMLKLEAKTLGQVSCMLECLVLIDFVERQAALESCMADSGRWTTNSLTMEIDFTACDFVDPTPESDDVAKCGYHKAPMNDGNMSGTPGYVDWYYNNYGTAYPLPDNNVASGNGTDADNAPATDVKACVSTCCTHPPTDGWDQGTEQGQDLSAALENVDRAEPLPVSNGSHIEINALPDHLKALVTHDSIPNCGYCGSEVINGTETLVRCAYCIDSCCDPPDTTYCLESNAGKEKTCTDSHAASLLSVWKPTVQVASHQGERGHPFAQLPKLVKVFNKKVDTKNVPASGSKKWHQIVSRARRQAESRLKRRLKVA